MKRKNIKHLLKEIAVPVVVTYSILWLFWLIIYLFKGEVGPTEAYYTRWWLDVNLNFPILIYVGVTSLIFLLWIKIVDK